VFEGRDQGEGEGGGGVCRLRFRSVLQEGSSSTPMKRADWRRAFDTGWRVRTNALWVASLFSSTEAVKLRHLAQAPLKPKARDGKCLSRRTRTVEIRYDQRQNACRPPSIIGNRFFPPSCLPYCSLIPEHLCRRGPSFSTPVTKLTPRRLLRGFSRPPRASS
jgi:hypothetical protein